MIPPLIRIRISCLCLHRLGKPLPNGSIQMSVAVAWSVYKTCFLSFALILPVLQIYTTESNGRWIKHKKGWIAERGVQQACQSLLQQQKAVPATSVRTRENEFGIDNRTVTSGTSALYTSVSLLVTDFWQPGGDLAVLPLSSGIGRYGSLCFCKEPTADFPLWVWSDTGNWICRQQVHKGIKWPIRCGRHRACTRLCLYFSE